ncbi:MAG: cytochrome-c peroxidase, partial [Acidobacteria bacterium]|nr:cytochrome-c peroxidase [Acidobacteriota bacterium]
MRGIVLAALFLGLALTLAATSSDAAVQPGRGIALPAELPEPAVPSANPFSPAKAELGRYLFHDRRLSGNGTYACASCHQQARAFTDGRTTAIGATGEPHRRNSMSLANVVYNSVFNWADSETTSLEQQALVPMFGSDPIEMGMAGVEDRILAAIAADPDYRRLFPAAFPG